MEILLESKKAEQASVALNYPWIFSTWFENLSVKKAFVKTKEIMNSDNRKTDFAFKTKDIWDVDRLSCLKLNSLIYCDTL